ncbi:MAG: viroplasmin family protein [bacterium]
MAKTKQKYYVVWKGRKSGIFESWQECNKQVSGFAGARFKAFPTRQAAEQAFQNDSSDYIGAKTFEPDLSAEKLKAIGAPVLDSISVDAACDMVTGVMEYRGVETRTGKVLFQRGPFEGGTNNVGEFLAIVHAAALLKKQNSKLPIYTDSRTAMSWVRKKKANTKLAATKKNEKLFELIAQAEQWLAENEISNKILKWETRAWGEIAADYGRK